MLTFFTALCQKVVNPPSLKLFVSATIDDVLTVSADLHKANVGVMEKNQQLHQSIEYTVCMLTFFAALCQKVANPSSLKLFVSVIIDDVLIVSADLCRANVGDMKKINNHINPLKIQCACSQSLQLYARKWQILPL